MVIQRHRIRRLRHDGRRISVPGINELSRAQGDGYISAQVSSDSFVRRAAAFVRRSSRGVIGLPESLAYYWSAGTPQFGVYRAPAGLVLGCC